MSDLIADFDKEVEKLEEIFLQLSQVECPVNHHFGPGIYIREVIVPAGSFAIGHKQKKPHLNIFLKGKVKILKEDGTTEILEAPQLFVGQPGRKIGYVLEDMVWLNVYATEERDIEKLEDEFLEKSEVFKKYSNNYSTAQLKLPYVGDLGYAKMLEDLGVTEELVRQQSENTEDLIPFPLGTIGVQVAPSPVEGKGLFAVNKFKSGDLIVPAKIGDKRTPAGRYTNHSDDPNAIMVAIGNDVYLQAVKDIRGQCGGQLGEEILVDYRQSVALIRGLLCPESQQQ